MSKGNFISYPKARKLTCDFLTSDFLRYAGGSHRLHAVYPACLALDRVIPWQLSLRYWHPYLWYLLPVSVTYTIVPELETLELVLEELEEPEAPDEL